MYWLSELIGGLPELHFTQIVGGEDRERYRLVAWAQGARITCEAQNLGGFVDAWSCAGFMNALLRDLFGREERVMLRVDAAFVQVVAGRPRGLRRLERERFFD